MMENPKNRKWKVLTSEYLARKPWFTVRHESLELPDGRRIPDYYVFEYPDWINVTAVTRDGRFVLIDQYRHGLGETSYEIRAGGACPRPYGATPEGVQKFDSVHPLSHTERCDSSVEV